MIAGVSLKDRYLTHRYPLAHKGMGKVWLAQDKVLDRPVVIKMIDDANLDTELVRRFRREALLTARLDHPGVPAIYDIGEHRGYPYLVLEKIDGVALDDLVAEQGPLPTAWVAAIGAQISCVLIAAAQIGLTHRDIKPGNVMLEPSGAVKVLDFGLAVIHGDDRYSRITQSGQSLGTLGYAAPEQIYGEPTDHRADLYGLGGTLFDLLTGERPFGDATTLTMLRAQLEAVPPRPSRSRPDVPAELDNLVHALLAVRPDDRPASAAEVYAALAPLTGDLRPIPGVVPDQPDAVRAYAAVVGQVPQPGIMRIPPRQPGTAPALSPAPTRGGPVPSPRTAAVGPTLEQLAEQAEQAMAAGEYRSAARQWRQLADGYAQQHGEDDPTVFDYRLRAARAHLPLGERHRALRALRALLEDRRRVDGPGHSAVLALQEEIEQLSAEDRSPG